MKYTKLMSVLSDALNNKYPITIYLKNGVVFISERNTGAFESTNCLELDDPEYLEYYACGVEITKLHHIPNNEIDEEIGKFKEGSFIELSELDEPMKIELSDGQLVWIKQ